MKKRLLYVALLAQLLSVKAQEKSFKDQMVASDEKAPEFAVKDAKISNQFLEFKRAKAWKSKLAANSIFSNPADLDIVNIGGRVRASLVDLDNNIALVAPSGGGLWTFNPVTGTPFVPLDDFGSFLAITDIKQHPNRKKELLIATGDEKHGTVGNGIFKSVDGGKTFEPLESTNPKNDNDFKFLRYIRYAPNAEAIYIASRDKIFKSKDEGKTWTEVFKVNNFGFIHAIDFLNNGKMIVGVDYQGVYTSTTGELGSFVADTKLPFDKAGRDKGYRGVIVAVSPSNRNIAYTVICESKPEVILTIHKTINGGVSWTKVIAPNFPRVSQTSFSMTIGVHPNDPNTVILGNIGWAYSRDGATSWERAAGLEVDYHDIHFHESSPDVAYIGYDQGIGRVDFNKTQMFSIWDNIQKKYVQKQQIEQVELGKKEGFNTTQIYSGDYFPEEYGDSYIEGQQDGGSFAIVNGKSRRVVVGDGGAAFVNKQNPKKAYASAQSGWITRTENALNPLDLNTGKYVRIDGFYKNHPHFVTQFVGNNADGTQLYIPKNNSLERTVNGGDSFTSIFNHELEYPFVTTEDRLNPIVYMVGFDRNARGNDFVRIENAKTTPIIKHRKKVLSSAEVGRVTSITMNPNDRNSVYVTTQLGLAFKITNLDTDTPKSTPINGDIPNVFFNTVIGVKEDPEIVIAGTNIGVFFSTDSGKTWTISNELPYTKVMDLKLRNSDKRLFVFTHGRGAWVVSVLKKSLTVKDFTKSLDLEIYPNPVHKDGVISIKADNNLKFDKVNIYDKNGKKVIVTKNRKHINVSGLSSGVYILHIMKNKRIVFIKKIIVV
ncbi:Por_Secre_tail domain-containing protein [Tenacibaculum sp. 190524A02b]|uniref:Por_Secre_tail domain-containing protein n=1 Tax=Tenacibaculum vairaonense TaxID=3137860 RepID=A0ABM9PJ25_9FLAO